MAVTLRSLWTGALVAGAVLLVLAVERIASQNALDEGLVRAETTLRQTVNGLDGHLRRFEALPALLARDDRVRDALAAPDDAAGIAAMNSWLEETNALIEASDLYLIDLSGTTIAASNHKREDSFIGQNFSYRPYFTEARDGRSGHFFALGTTSGVRGYYFASSVRDAQGQIVGVLALKIGADEIEAAWRARDYRILVTDPEGIVFMSTDAVWLYRGLLPLTPERLARTEVSRRYADAKLSALQVGLSASGKVQLMRLADGNGASHEYIATEHVMPQAGWTVRVLLDTAPLRTQARLAVLAFGLLLLVALLLAWTVFQRRARLAERLAIQAAAQADLERQVAERTADLTRANDDLHRMQADLVQAGKLAALGRISAALSHEINQPLAAARNYADSAGLLIDRADLPRAKENIGQIVALIDRMAAIARHLRNVARKPNEPLKTVDLHTVITDALTVARNRLDSAGATVDLDIAPDLPLVRGGPVRLQQVIVNVLSNAADAVEGSADRRITLAARAVGGEVQITVRDRGPGVAPAIANRIFDPFFTTKQVGSGLGLGLSISYNIMKDFAGDLRVSNHPDGGAIFTIALTPASPEAMAAE
ncbi:sensor histidine kinase [Tabrizicola piscis]|uniref:C4-dicarboxylate transport sensor protein DctB n=1 Tax=Tabrizicola piscis TaxID=2494374 RepID=A0A3S8U3S2_9RHOB|nr:ATP-binding protein [Tabrizicola piscis]AZL58247.1 sensor histidine kinase [Tabrizicola piscis]